MLVRVTNDGVIKRTRKRVELKAELGHFYLGKAPWTPGQKSQAPRPKIVTALGFEYLNTFSPLAWVPMPTLKNSDGKEVGNPENRIKTDGYVRVSQFAVGRASDGTMRAHELTLTYDLNAYFAADIYKKFSTPDKDSKNSPVWGELMNVPAAMEEIRKHKSKSSVVVGPDIALVFDLKHPEVMALFKEHNEQRRFADRFAVSICRRNIYKKHFGFTNAPDSGVVFLDCWDQPEVDFESLRDNIVTRNGRVMIDGEEVQVEAMEATVNAEDMEAAGQDDDGEGTIGEAPVATQEPSVDKAKALLRASIRSVGGTDAADKVMWSKTSDELKAKLKAVGVSSVLDFKNCNDIGIISAITDVYTQHRKAQDGSGSGTSRGSDLPGSGTAGADGSGANRTDVGNKQVRSAELDAPSVSGR